MSYAIEWKLAAAGIILAGLLLAGSDNKELQKSTAISSAEEPAAQVNMTNSLKFTPDTVRIKKGQTVKWINGSLLVHSVTADPSEQTMEGSVHLPDGAQPFNSGMMDPKKSFSHTFQTTGSYTYFCIPHEAAKMRGVVIVK